MRVNSIDIERGMIYVRLGKGGKDRGVPLPKTLTEKLKSQLETVRHIHAADLADGFGEAWLPEGFAKKMGPGARDLGWQYLFPAKITQIYTHVMQKNLAAVASPLDTLRNHDPDR